MSKVQALTAVFASYALGLFTLHDGSSSAAIVISSLALFGCITVLEGQRTKNPNDLQGQIKELKNKVEAIMINKGFGR